MTVRVRPADVADAVALSRLGAATFRETFEADNTTEDMARYLAEAFSPGQQASEIADPKSAVLVAEQGSIAEQVSPRDRPGAFSGARPALGRRPHAPGCRSTCCC